MRVLMLFVDGVGLGNPDPVTNPFFLAELPAFRSLYGGALPSLAHAFHSSTTATCIPLDANLGVEGLPQSGTGQATLFTGVNAAQLIGKHFGPYPYSTLRPIIGEKSLFRQLLHAGKRPFFANAYPQKFFDYIGRHPGRMSVTVLSCTVCNLALLQAEDLAAGRGVSADITSQGWSQMGYPEIPTITPQEAGRRLVQLLQENDFVLFEYWQTDRAGHSEKMEDAVSALERLDALLEGILSSLDASNTLLVITSDHGNIEDMSTKSHTRNPVPLVLFGHRHDALLRTIQFSSQATPDLTTVTPAILELLSQE